MEFKAYVFPAGIPISTGECEELSVRLVHDLNDDWRIYYIIKTDVLVAILLSRERVTQ